MPNAPEEFLLLKHAGDGAVDALAQLGIAGDADAPGHAVDVEQRQRPAHGLLGAAVGIAVEGIEDARHVEGPVRPHRDGHLGAAQDQVVQQIARQGDLAGLGGERGHRQALDVAGRYLDVEGERTPHIDAAGPGDAQGELRQPHLGGLQLERLALALAGGQRDAVRESGRYPAIRLPLDHATDGIVARLPLDVVQGHLQPGRVAQGQEPRGRHGDGHRIAHDHVLRRRADLAGAPGHRRQAHRAVEIGELELGFRRAVGADLDDAREQGQGRLHRRAALHGHLAPVAAGAQPTALGAHTVDQAPVEVADLAAQAALAVEPGVGSRGLEPRQVEDARVGRRDGDARLLAGSQAGELDGNREQAARADLLRHVEADAQRARLLVDGEPAQADGAAGHAPGLLVERAIEHDGHVGAGAPAVAHFERHLAAADRQVHLLGAEQPGAHDGDERAAGHA